LIISTQEETDARHGLPYQANQKVRRNSASTKQIGNVQHSNFQEMM
jgi:hypothetical protein